MRKNGLFVLMAGLLALVGLVACGGGGGGDDNGGGGSGVFDKYDCDTNTASSEADGDVEAVAEATADATSEMDPTCVQTICYLKTGYEQFDNAGCNTNSATKKVCAAEKKCVTDYVACIEEKCPSFGDCGTAYNTCVQAAAQAGL